MNCQPKFVISDADQVGKILEIAKEVTSIQVCLQEYTLKTIAFKSLPIQNCII